MNLLTFELFNKFYIPREIKEIIDDYVQDLKVLELFYKFFDMYAKRFKLKKMDPLKDDVKVKFTPLETEDVIKLWDGCDMYMITIGVNLDNSVSDGIHTALDGLQSVCEVSTYLKLFHMIFDCGEYQQCKNDGEFFEKLDDLVCPANIMHPSFDHQPFMNAHTGTHMFYKDYYLIFSDYNSIDNGAGFLYINLNPKSTEYDHVYSYSSSDDGVSRLVATSFVGLIYALIFRGVCSSTCDCLNNLVHDSTCAYTGWDQQF